MTPTFNFTHKLYFSVLQQDNPQFMLLFDHSLYSQDTISAPVYDIIPPGYDDPTRINAVAKSITSINSGLLFPVYTTEVMELGPLVDGIYNITYRIQPYDTFYYTQNEFRTTMLERSLDEVYIRMEANERHATYPQWQRDLLNVTMLISTVKALTRLGSLQEASDMYTEVQIEAYRLINITQKLLV